MEGKKNIKLFREIKSIIVTFFIPYKLIDPMFEVPKSIYNIGFQNGLISLLITAITLFFTFTLKASNYFIEQQYIFVGIIFFLLYVARNMVQSQFNSISRATDKKFHEALNNSLVSFGAIILGVVTNKVEKYDKKEKCYKLMLNRRIMNTLKRYVGRLWEIKINYVFNIFKFINIIIMLVFTIWTNKHIPQIIFIPLITGFIIFAFVMKAYNILSTDSYYQTVRATRDEQSTLVDDLIKTPFIVKQDLAMRLSRLNKSLTKTSDTEIKFNATVNSSNFILSSLETTVNFVIVISLLYGIGFDSINLTTIPELLATLLIVQTAISQVRELAYVTSDHYRWITNLKEEEEDVTIILNTYHNEKEHASSVNKINNLNIDPFTISYTEKSENDRPFTLVSAKSININNGEIVILSGPSGSGKSTFMKMITERIRLKKSVSLPSTSRFMFFDENLRLGSLSIYEELFCDEEIPNLSKMQNILKNMNLWNEISASCEDIWIWMKEKSYSDSLSNGQKQRLILSKMLYWLDDSIDVIVLDECTSGLDVRTPEEFADAERILEYIVRFCNKDKKRIIMISTHQDISGFVTKMSNDYTFRNLVFGKIGEQNLITEI